MFEVNAFEQEKVSPEVSQHSKLDSSVSKETSNNHLDKIGFLLNPEHQSFKFYKEIEMKESQIREEKSINIVCENQINLEKSSNFPSYF